MHVYIYIYNPISHNSPHYGYMCLAVSQMSMTAPSSINVHHATC